MSHTVRATLSPPTRRITLSSVKTIRREARLRQEFGSLYAGVPVNQWRPIGELLDCVNSARLRTGRRSGELLRGRPLDDRHFEFRGGEERAPRPPSVRTRMGDALSRPSH
jgi:hypothetical protein